MATEVVVKVGGSLFDLPGFARQLQAWLSTLPTRRVVLVPGGGAAADMVRVADAQGQLGEEQGHWLALRALTFTAHLLAARIENGVVIHDLADRAGVWQRGLTPVLDMHAFAVADESCFDHLPHLWKVTSDSLSARVARIMGAEMLVLLKSCDLPARCGWKEAARRGLVDRYFPGLVAEQGSRLQIKAVNLRSRRAADTSKLPPPSPAP